MKMPIIPKNGLTILLIFIIVVMIFLLVKSNLMEGATADFIEDMNETEEKIRLLVEDKKQAFLNNPPLSYYSGVSCPNWKRYAAEEATGERTGSYYKNKYNDVCISTSPNYYGWGFHRAQKARQQAKLDLVAAPAPNDDDDDGDGAPSSSGEDDVPAPATKCIDSTDSWQKRGGVDYHTCSRFFTNNLSERKKRRWCNYKTTKKRGGGQLVKNICPMSCGECGSGNK
jgi:hypothetical protein